MLSKVASGEMCHIISNIISSVVQSLGLKSSELVRTQKFFFFKKAKISTK